MKDLLLNIVMGIVVAVVIVGGWLGGAWALAYLFNVPELYPVMLVWPIVLFALWLAGMAMRAEMSKQR